MPSAIVGILMALPELLKDLNSLGIRLDKFWTWLQETSGNDPVGYLEKIGETFGQLSKANTPEEHSDAAKSIADLLRNLPHP